MNQEWTTARMHFGQCYWCAQSRVMQQWRLCSLSLTWSPKFCRREPYFGVTSLLQQDWLMGNWESTVRWHEEMKIQRSFFCTFFFYHSCQQHSLKQHLETSQKGYFQAHSHIVKFLACIPPPPHPKFVCSKQQVMKILSLNLWACAVYIFILAKTMRNA